MFFLINVNDTILPEEHKTIYSGLWITGMDLFNNSELPAVFSHFDWT
jgi:hypothetical protein